ncbi:hypothetical protein FHU10_2226 [Serratia fonticola]|jgi:hypothetical protein|uniref:Uncharacterized protein n=1 Tax=Serratia fonticola TaxID=47917 RepID=A0A542CWJ6_SERFO|nr:hypothetical protein [Serratia fonticola]TQI77806.1 hypothetical protein FHU09_0226 [Serratia fonticola]TQI95199.1 hypothetical protein FHU11_0567 [Serratia fonticola]TVZ69696.1 hypothetical protein FHU10_2226 [Serratia fonticola]
MKIALYDKSVNIIKDGKTVNLPSNNSRWPSDFSKDSAFEEKDGIYRSKLTTLLVSSDPGISFPYHTKAHITASLSILPMDAQGKPLPFTIAATNNTIFDGKEQKPAVTVEVCVFGQVAKFYNLLLGMVEDRTEENNLEVSINYSCFFDDRNVA